MSTVDIDDFIDQKSRDLLTRSESCGWAACAAIWARVFVLASPGWKRWPEFFNTVRDAFSLAMLRCIEPSAISPPELLIVKLESFEIEDDGSAEWQLVVDLIAMISAALDGQDARVCLQTAIRSYLEGMLNVLRNDYAVAAGGVISHDIAMKQLTADPEWCRAIEFIEAL
jgi:hypothetical protein